jgi:lysophospholipid acyltransferase (LPLAT)-like uncharacterized protein
MVKGLLRRPGVQALLAWLLGTYLRFALATTRWTLQGEEHLAAVVAARRGVAAFWHERLPLMPALFLRARRRAPGLRAAVLASRHADGRLLAAVMARFGAEVAHGSTARNGVQRGGAAGARTLLELIGEGVVAVITPDGPRGPPRVAAPGVAQLAGLAGVAVLPCAAQVRWRVRLATWDRMVLPLPFGHGALVCLAPVLVPREGWRDALPGIAAAMSAAADRADRALE